MLNEAIKLLNEYGWSAVLLFVVGGLLTRFITVQSSIWKQRSIDQIEKLEMRRQSELTNHQFFANVDFRLRNEIPTLVLNPDHPIRQKLFRKLLEVTLLSIKENVDVIIASNLEKMTRSEWATFVNAELQKVDNRIEDRALREGIPPILISKYIVWKARSAELLSSYVNDLAISEVYSTNLARTNTLLMLLNLKLITLIGDAEQSLMELNGEISGLSYKGDTIE